MTFSAVDSLNFDLKQQIPNTRLTLRTRKKCSQIGSLASSEASYHHQVFILGLFLYCVFLSILTSCSKRG